MKHRAIAVGDVIETVTAVGNTVTVEILTVGESRWAGKIQGDNWEQERHVSGFLNEPYRVLNRLI